MDYAPDLPWMPKRIRPVMRGRVILRVAPDEAPVALPHQLDVAKGLASALPAVQNGAIDSVLRRYSPAIRVMSAYSPAARVGNPESRHWDDLEHDTGLARTYRIDVDPDADLLSLVSAR